MPLSPLSSAPPKDKYIAIYVLLRLQVLPQLVDFTNCARIPKRGKVIIFVNSIDGCYKLKLFLERFAMKVAVLNAELPVNTR